MKAGLWRALRDARSGVVDRAQERKKKWPGDYRARMFPVGAGAGVRKRLRVDGVSGLLSIKRYADCRQPTPLLRFVCDEPQKCRCKARMCEAIGASAERAMKRAMRGANRVRAG